MRRGSESEAMKIIWLITLLAVVGAGKAGPDCVKMQKELSALRLEYHDYANGNHDTWGEVTFERLSEVLDEIIELKGRMRDANCRVLPREKDIVAAKKKRDLERSRQQPQPRPDRPSFR